MGLNKSQAMDLLALIDSWKADGIPTTYVSVPVTLFDEINAVKMLAYDKSVKREEDFQNVIESGDEEGWERLCAEHNAGNMMATAYVSHLHHTRKKHGNVGKLTKICFPWLQAESAMGNAFAQYMLGLFYATGNRVLPGWMTSGFFPHDEAGLPDWAKAFPLFQSAADQGRAAAQYETAKCYFSGRGTARDDAKAVHYFSLAAVQGHVDAQYRLAQCHRYGWGIASPSASGHQHVQVVHSYDAPDTTSLLEKALPFYEIAAHNGHAGAQYVLGRYYEDRWDSDASAYYLNLAADQGHIGACNRVGDPECHFYKSNSTKSQAKHYEEAAGVWDGSTECLDACYKLGKIYRHGLGEAIDEAEAMSNFKQSTERVHHYYGEAAAQMGAMYENGEGVKVNFTKAAKWYRRAIRDGDEFTGAERRMHRLQAEGHVL